MANKIIEGGDLMVFVGGKSIAFSTNHTLSLTAETSDTSHKDVKGSWKTSTVKMFSWEVTSENLYADEGAGYTYDDLFGMMVAKTEVVITFGNNTGTLTQESGSAEGGWANDASKNYYCGKALITSLEVNAQNGDNATFTVTFTGQGELKQNAAVS